MKQGSEAVALSGALLNKQKRAQMHQSITTVDISPPVDARSDTSVAMSWGKQVYSLRESL
jgi:hypothetical protein